MSDGDVVGMGLAVRSSSSTQDTLHELRLFRIHSRCRRLIDRDLVPWQNCSRPVVRPRKQAGLQHINDHRGFLHDGAIAAHLHGDAAESNRKANRVIKRKLPFT